MQLFPIAFAIIHVIQCTLTAILQQIILYEYLNLNIIQCK